MKTSRFSNTTGCTCSLSQAHSYSRPHLSAHFSPPQSHRTKYSAPSSLHLLSRRRKADLFAASIALDHPGVWSLPGESSRQVEKRGAPELGRQPAYCLLLQSGLVNRRLGVPNKLVEGRPELEFVPAPVEPEYQKSPTRRGIWDIESLDSNSRQEVRGSRSRGARVRLRFKVQVRLRRDKMGDLQRGVAALYKSIGDSQSQQSDMFERGWIKHCFPVERWRLVPEDARSSTECLWSNRAGVPPWRLKSVTSDKIGSVTWAEDRQVPVFCSRFSLGLQLTLRIE